MPFDRQSLERINGGHAFSPTLWSYLTTDLQTTVELSGYFDDAGVLSPSDYLNVVSFDGPQIYCVASIDPVVVTPVTSGGSGVEFENVLVIKDESEIPASWLIPAPSPYDVILAPFDPSPMVYSIPDGWSVRATGGTIPVSYPFYGNGSCELAAVIPLVDGFDVTGATVPVLWLNDGDFCERFTIRDAVCFTVVTQDSRNQCNNIIDNCDIIAVDSGGSISDPLRFEWKDTVFGGMPSGGFVVTGELLDSFNFTNVITSDNAFFGVPTTLIDFTGIAATGNRIVNMDACICNAFVASAEFFTVTDENTIEFGTVSDCRIIDINSTGAVFYTGMDNRAIKTTFSGCNFQNTRPGGIVKVRNSVTPTPNPGLGNRTPILGTSFLGPNDSRVTMPADGILQSETIYEEDFYADFGARVTVPTGEHDFIVYLIDVNTNTVIDEIEISSADAFFFGTFVAGFGSNSTATTLDPANNQLRLDIECLTSGAVVPTITDYYLRIFLGGN